MAYYVIFGLVCGYLACVLFNEPRLQRAQLRLWQHIDELEADKRSLMESLCRAQGKPFVQPGKQERVPSEGWFETAPRIVIKDNDT